MSVVLKDIKDYNRVQLTGDVKKDIDKLQEICSERKRWTKIVKHTIDANQANVQ